jgi:glycerophosphoryl diester phosphodiesterase
MRLATCLLSVGLIACPAPPDSAGQDSAQPKAQVPEDLAFCFFDAGCPYVVSVAHRGASRHAPENTIAAFDAAIALGAHAVELDVRTSADGVLVVMHDSTVDRTTDGSGEVGAMSWAELQALVVPSEFDGVPDQSVPSFLEALEHIDGRLVVDVDVKDAEAEAMAADIAAAGMVDRVFLLSKSVEKAEAYRAADPAIAIMPNLEAPEQIEDYAHLEPELAEVDFLDIAEAAPGFAEHGVRLFTHGLGFEAVAAGNGTVEESWAGMVDDGAQVIQTDYPELLVPWLQELNRARVGAR